MTDRDPLSVQCSACLAPVGQQCYATSTDEPRRHPHRMRVLAASLRLKQCTNCRGMGFVPDVKQPANADPRAVLDLPMGENDAQAATIREYLITLLSALWRHGEDFSSKRPFGNSGWASELEVALGRAGLIDVTFDEDGCLVDVDSRKADALITEAIRALGVAA